MLVFSKVCAGHQDLMDTKGMGNHLGIGWLGGGPLAQSVRTLKKVRLNNQECSVSKAR